MKRLCLIADIFNVRNPTFTYDLSDSGIPIHLSTLFLSTVQNIMAPHGE